MNTDPLLVDALARTHDRLRRAAMLRLALHAWFAVAGAIGAVQVAHVLHVRGTAALAAGWPTVLPLLAGLVLAGWLLRSQYARAAALRRHALPVLELLRTQQQDLRSQRRQSIAILAFAAATTPLLWLAVALLIGRGMATAAQGFGLAALCTLPALVIGGMHGSRLRRCARERVRLAALQQHWPELAD